MQHPAPFSIPLYSPYTCKEHLALCTRFAKCRYVLTYPYTVSQDVNGGAK